MRKSLVLCSAAVLGACGQHDTAPYTEAAGAPKSTETRALEAGARLLQGQAPLNAISAYLNGFHFYNGDMNGQMEAHHYVTRLNEEVMQALIYDGNGRDAKLMGVEYIISARLFETLPEEEKKLWHSHDYEVKSGTLVAPGLPEVAERQLMEQVVSTYGKTWHTWHTDRDKELPYGIPALMMGFTADGQLDPALEKARDRRIGVDTRRPAATANRFPNPRSILPPMPGSRARSSSCSGCVARVNTGMAIRPDRRRFTSRAACSNSSNAATRDERRAYGLSCRGGVGRIRISLTSTWAGCDRA